MKKHTFFLLAAIIILAGSFLTSANATQRTFQFTGTISSSNISGVFAGDYFVATISYDDEQAPFVSYYNTEGWYSNFTFELTVSGSTFVKQSTEVIEVANDEIPPDYNLGWPSESLIWDIFAVRFFGPEVLPAPWLNLTEYEGTSWSSINLPSAFTLANFEEATVGYAVTSTDRFVGIITSITDITPIAGLCPQPQGDWKNKPDWPVEELLLGTQPYSQAELVDILNLPVGRGMNADASLILAKQLIAAKLNIANGVVASEEIQDSVDSADELIGSNTIPMNVGPRTASGKQMTNVAGYLDSFNKGEFTEGCSLSKSANTEDNKTTQVLPEDYVLNQNFPNPFNPTTQIRFGLPQAGNVTLKIYNSVGQLVKTLVDGNMSEGYHQVTWDATDNSGSKLSSGVYFYRITAGTFTQVNKMMFLK